MKMIAVTTLVGLMPLIASAADEGEWTRFRGPQGQGKSSAIGVPSEWTEADYAWQIELPGVGHSSPVLWGKKLFITTGRASDSGSERCLLCLDADTGREIWRAEVPLAASHLHRKNSWASGSAAVDAGRVVAVFADEMNYLLIAWNHDGQELWRRDLGAFESQHGQGVSPIITGDLVIVPNDQLGPSTMLAVDVATGETRWQSDRLSGKTSYATPWVLNSDSETPQLITLSQAGGIAALDLKTGETLWSGGEMPMRTVASPVLAGGLLVGYCGSGGSGKYLCAVRPDEVADEDRIVLEMTKQLPYVPTAMGLDDLLFLWGDDGRLTCLELPQGDVVWRGRLRGAFSGSPVLIDGRLFCISEEGTVFVVEAGREFRILSQVDLGDESYATPAVANGHVYFRTFHGLKALKF